MSCVLPDAQQRFVSARVSAFCGRILPLRHPGGGQYRGGHLPSPAAADPAFRPGVLSSSNGHLARARASRPSPTRRTRTPPSTRRSSWPPCRRATTCSTGSWATTRPVDHRARDQYPWGDANCPVRPGGQAPVPAYPRPGEDPCTGRARANFTTSRRLPAVRAAIPGFTLAVTQHRPAGAAHSSRLTRGYGSKAQQLCSGLERLSQGSCEPRTAHRSRGWGAMRASW
jgi:hypothetical protein